MDDPTVKPPISTPTPFTQAEALETSSTPVVAEVATSRLEEFGAIYQSYGWVLDLVALGVGIAGTYRQFTTTKPAEKKQNPTDNRLQTLNLILDDEGKLTDKATLWDIFSFKGNPEIDNNFQEYCDDILADTFDVNDTLNKNLENALLNLDLPEETKDRIRKSPSFVNTNLRLDKAKQKQPELAAIIDPVIQKHLETVTLEQFVDKRNRLPSIKCCLIKLRTTLREKPQEKLSNTPVKELDWKVFLPLILAVGVIAFRRYALPSLMGRISR